MAERAGARWDTRGLAFGLLGGVLLGGVLLLARDGTALRPVHLLGVVVLAVGAAVLLAAVDRSGGGEAGRGRGPAPLD